MQLKDAVQKAMNDIKVMGLDGYFLASIFSITEEGKDISDWTLLFYNPETKKTRDCFVNEKFVTLGEEMPAQKEMKELVTSGMKVKVTEAIDTALKNFDKKIINILISLHTTERVVWTITVVAADITATSFDIDAGTGKVLREETVSLMKRL
ncbi:MAG: PepSY domain-containing protein [Candidatus Aenigmarchaeota archaeon]|nr:PepSY domain-containing protein [Candidatus Aenigmarchaeota archaeon]